MRLTLTRAAAVLTTTAVTALAPLSMPSADAATSTSCTGGGFTVTMPDGRTVRGDASAKIANTNLPEAARLVVKGRYVEFELAPVTGNIYNYVYTGAANAESLTAGVRTPIWDSKTLSLGPVLRTETEARTGDTDLTILARGKAGKVKIQAKDCATGGIFQQEVESEAVAKPVVFTHTLAPGMSYFVNPYTQKVNFGNGGVFRGKDSPQVATRLTQTATVAVWSVSSGGRMGGVLGEDSVELSAGATACTSDCQAQNQVRGSLPVTDPAFAG
jgi:hypothetical protein